MSGHKTHSLGFRKRHLIARRGPSAVHYLSKPVTFWIAVLSLFAFVSGNILGHEGVYVLWASMWAQYDDSLIVYEGTTSPIPQIPDPVKWIKYGGNQNEHTYEQAPKDILIPYPHYQPLAQISKTDVIALREYSTDYAGGYASEQGSHPGIDMAAPAHTPVVAAMNGYVTKVAFDPGGFGNYIMLRHPNVPDPRNPSKTTTLYSLYGHLDATVATVGSIVKKGEVIGTVGRTGDASGNHLHFQVGYDGKSIWPFTGTEARNAGMSFTQAIDRGLNRDRVLTDMVNPMAYVQAHYAPVGVTIAQATTKSSSSRMTLAERAAARKQSRGLVASSDVRVAIADPVVASPLISSSASAVAGNASTSSSVSSVPATPAVIPAAPSAISEVSIDVPFDFGKDREWQKIRITLRDEHGDSIKNPVLDRPLALRTAFGKADFRPSVLTDGNFKNGSAEVEILPFGQTTVVVELYPLNTLSKPIRYAGR
jgi:murein DD-endopeptidase MepM/ murein hydrolase activator NlpD